MSDPYALPPGFHFQPYLGGPSLHVGEEQVASACPARDEPGAPWRLCLRPRRPPRYEFLPNEDACLRYMAAWARRWEAEIRDRCALPSTAFAHLATTGATPATQSRHPRHRSRRPSGL